MYYIIIAAIAVVLFLLRKRILGGIVGALTLLMVIALTIFMLDFFWTGSGFVGGERDVRNFEPTKEVVEKYDESVKDPDKVVKDIAGNVVSKGEEINKKIEDTGSDLDKKLGIQKDESNNNLWGDEGDNEEEGEDINNVELEGNEEPEGNEKQDKGNSVKEEEGEKESFVEKVKRKFRQGDSKGEKDTESKDSEKEEIKDKKGKGLVEFGDLSKVQELWGLTDEDFKFVKSASPFNTGKFSNGRIEIEVKEEGVLMTGGGE